MVVMRGRALLRALLGVALVLGFLRVMGVVISRQATEGDEEADAFSIAAILGGATRVSRAAALREGRVLAASGGVQLDLREATLDPGGAELLLQAYFGGIQVLVPAGWRVVVESDATMGGVDARVTDEAELAADAPALRVEARAVLGGVQVTTRGGDDDEEGGRRAAPSVA
jgi:predicted membrane protein